MTTTLPIPPSSEQTVNPLTVAVSTSVSTNGGIQIQPATDSEVADTELRIPTTATDLSILRSKPTDIGLIIGIVVIVIVVIVSAVTVVVIIAVLFKRHGNMVVIKPGALANPAYGTRGQCKRSYFYVY